MRSTRYGLEIKRAMAAQPGIAQRLIGRQAELDVIQAHIDAALAGGGRLLLFAGEAGIGKSRLLAELAARFGNSAADGLVLTGNCFEGNRALAYAPLLDLLRAHLIFQSADPERLFAPDPAAFITLLPELQPRFPAVEPLAGSSPQQEKHRIFSALVGLVVQMAGEAPLLIVLEDLHWSDDASLEFLVQLARVIPTLPVLVAASFRPEEEHGGLRRALIDLDRARLATELAIDRLAISEVDLLLRDIFEQPYSIHPDFLRTIFALTEGNPFFVEETVRSLIAAGDIYRVGGRWTRRDLSQLRIPRSVQDAVAQRTERLDQVALRALEDAAVIGQRFDFGLLQRMTDFEEAVLVDALRALIDARLIEEETAERFSFRHALIRESVYDRLLARERRSRHAHVAVLLEDLHADMPEPWFAEMAYHFHAAERWEQAFEYASAAGERAEQLFAPHAASEQFTRALEATRRLDRTPPVELLRRRGRANETLGSFPEARQDFEAALEIARAAGDRRQEWDAVVDLGRSWEGLDYDRAGIWFERAIDLAREIGEPAALAHSFNRVGNWYINTDRVDEARAAHQEALAIFETLGDEPGIAATVDYLGTVADIAGDLFEMRARYGRAARMFERCGDLPRLSSTLASMTVLSGAFVFEAVSAAEVATHAEAEEWGARGLRLARDIGWRAGESYALMNLGGLYVVTARFGEALDALDAASEIARDIEHREWLTGSAAIRGHLYQEILAGERAIESLDAAALLAHDSGSRHFIHVSSGFLVDTLVGHGYLERAGEVLRRFSPELPMQTIGQRLLWAARANWLLHSGNAEESVEIIDDLFRTGLNVRSIQDIPLLAWRRGAALARLGRMAEAEESLRAARTGLERLKQPGRIWKVCLEMARLFQMDERPDEAAAALSEASTLAEQLSAAIPDEELRRNFLERFFEQARSIAPNAGARPLDIEQLTARERDVAILVARGLSNRQIADELFIGERTVETHVGNILAKLGFTSRTQVATWVVETSGAAPS